MRVVGQDGSKLGPLSSYIVTVAVYYGLCIRLPLHCKPRHLKAFCPKRSRTFVAQFYIGFGVRAAEDLYIYIYIYIYYDSGSRSPTP